MVPVGPAGRARFGRERLREIVGAILNLELTHKEIRAKKLTGMLRVFQKIIDWYLIGCFVELYSLRKTPKGTFWSLTHMGI